MIPPGHEAHVPVDITRNRFSSSKDNWVTEPKLLAPGIVTARVVLSGAAMRSTIRVVNYSRKPLHVNSDLLVGVASPATLLTEPRTDSATKTDASRVNILHTAPPTPDDVSHVDCIIERLPKDLTPEEMKRATELIRSKAHIFSRNEYDVGRTDVIEHSIDTKDHKPIKQQLRRHATLTSRISTLRLRTC